MNRKLVLLVLSCFMVASYAADRQVYKWTDAGGVVHFSDSPPPKDAKNVQLMRVGGDSHAYNVDASADGNNAAANSGNANGAAQSADHNDANAKACATARNNLDILNSKIPVSVTGADGKPILLDDKTRAAQVAAANANVELYCKP